MDLREVYCLLDTLIEYESMIIVFIAYGTHVFSLFPEDIRGCDAMLNYYFNVSQKHALTYFILVSIH